MSPLTATLTYYGLASDWSKSSVPLSDWLLIDVVVCPNVDTRIPAMTTLPFDQIHLTKYPGTTRWKLETFISRIIQFKIGTEKVETFANYPDCQYFMQIKEK